MKFNVDRKTVESIAELAQLKLHEDDLQEYKDSMSNILDMVEEMQSVDTQGIEPMAHPLETTQRLRPDVVSETDNHTQFQSIAPDTEAGMYLVPQVIES